MASHLPRVSLLVAMRNEARYIERCLRSIMAQDYPGDCLEVFAIDGQSTDDTREIAARVFGEHVGCHVLSNPQRIQSAAWNLGVRQATGTIVGIVSAHAELAPDYLLSAVETLERTRATLVGGPMRAHGEGRVGRAVAIATSTRFGVGGARFHYSTSEQEVDTVYMGLCRREVYERLGGFDERMVRNQDDELSYRLLDAGGRIVCNPAIRSTYYNRATWRSLWRQYFNYGYWKIRVIRRHPRQMRLRHAIPAAFVATLLILTVLGIAAPATRLLLWLVLAAYSAANLCASAAAGRKARMGDRLLLPGIFATLHVAYGAGFLTGLWAAAAWRRHALATAILSK